MLMEGIDWRVLSYNGDLPLRDELAAGVSLAA